MKVCQPSENFNSLNKLILQLQLSLELTQIQELLTTYTDLFIFLAQYTFLYETTNREIPPITQDPARDGGNWWNYCNGNPVRFIDINGLFSNELQTAFDNHMDETYVSGSNDCDIWLENRINEAYPQNTLVTDWGDANTTNATGHRDNLSDSLTDNMNSSGEYIVIQQSTTAESPNHVMAACLNEDGSVDITHMTNNPSGGQNPDTNAGYPETIHYNTQAELLNDGWGTLQFYALSNSLD